MSAWLTEFENFSAFHGVTVAVCFGVVIAVVLAARAARRRSERGSASESGAAFVQRLGEPSMRRALGLFGVVWMAWTTVWWLMPGNFDAYESLPLHMCDVCMILGPVAWLTGWRWATTLVVHWGLGLTTQAFATPHLDAGLAEIDYWMFFVGHSLILLAALYPVVVLGYRPRGRDLLLVLGAGLAFVALVTPVNLALDVNYGYVGNAKPSSPTVIDALGPWPGRVLWIVLLGNGMVAMVWGVLAWLPGGSGARRVAERPAKRAAEQAANRPSEGGPRSGRVR